MPLGDGVEFTAFSFESVTVDDASTSITASVTGTAPRAGEPAVIRRGQRALVTVATAQIRFRYDGTAPSSTVGHLAEAGDKLEILGYDNILNFRAIRTTATNATLSVTLEIF